MTKLREFETTNICLGAALLALVPGSSLLRISTSPSVDGKRTLTITYPAEQESTARQTIEAFLQRRLVVDLYAYNKMLNALRDQLRQPTMERSDGRKYHTAVT